jgi:hypothetical protein
LANRRDTRATIWKRIADINVSYSLLANEMAANARSTYTLANPPEFQSIAEVPSRRSHLKLKSLYRESEVLLNFQPPSAHESTRDTQAPFGMAAYPHEPPEWN